MILHRSPFGHNRSSRRRASSSTAPVILNAEALAIGDSQKHLARRVPRTKGASEALGGTFGAAMPSSTAGKVATGALALALAGWLLSVSTKTRR